MTLPLPNAVTRFGENEERFDRVLNATGGYVDRNGVPRETWPDLAARIESTVATLAKRSDGVVSFLEAGMDPTGVADNTSILNALIVSASAARKTIIGNSGIYRFNSPVFYRSFMKLVMSPNCVLMFYVDGTSILQSSADADPVGYRIEGGVIMKPDRGLDQTPGVGGTQFGGSPITLRGSFYYVDTTVDVYAGRAAQIYRSFDALIRIQAYNPRPFNTSGPGGIRIYNGERVIVYGSNVTSSDDAFQFVNDSFAGSLGPIVNCSYQNCRANALRGHVAAAIISTPTDVAQGNSVIDCGFYDVSGKGGLIVSAGQDDDINDTSSLEAGTISRLTVSSCSFDLSHKVEGVDDSDIPGCDIRAKYGRLNSIWINNSTFKGHLGSAAKLPGTLNRGQINSIELTSCHFGKSRTGKPTLNIVSLNQLRVIGGLIEAPDPGGATPAAIYLQDNVFGPGTGPRPMNIIFSGTLVTGLQPGVTLLKSTGVDSLRLRDVRAQAIADGCQIFDWATDEKGVIVEGLDISGTQLSGTESGTLTNPFSTVLDSEIVTVTQVGHGLSKYRRVQFDLKTTGTLQPDPFTTSADSLVVSVRQPGHGRRPGELISFSGATAVNGVLLNGPYRVYKTQTNTYDVIAEQAATASGNGGGSAVGYVYPVRVAGIDVNERYSVFTVPSADTFTIRADIKANATLSGAGGSVGYTYFPTTVPPEQSTTVIANILPPYNADIQYRDCVGYVEPRLRVTTANTDIRRSDLGKSVAINSSNARTATLPSVAFLPGIPVGSRVRIIRAGSGSVTLVPGSGDTIISSTGSLAIAATGSAFDCELASEAAGVRIWYALAAG